MKKINLLPALSIIQQKEIMQWHTVTVLLLIITFVCLGAVQMLRVVQLHRFKNELAALHKKTHPYATLFIKQQRAEQEAGLLTQRMAELKIIGKKTESSVKAICALLQSSIKIKSLTLNNDLLELSFCCGNAEKAEKALNKLRSLSLFSELIPSSVQANEKGEVVIVASGTINI